MREAREGVVCRRPHSCPVGRSDRVRAGSIALLGLLVVLGWTGPVRAATYVVDIAKGSEENPGTADAPFKDIDQCAKIMVAGDVCDIRATGEYRKGWRAYRPVNSGRPNEWITFRGFGSKDLPRILPSPDEMTPPCTSREQQGAPALGWLDGEGTDYIRYSKLKVVGTIAVVGTPLDPSRGVQIDSSTFGDLVASGPRGPSYPCALPAVVHAENTEDLWVRDNLVVGLVAPELAPAPDVAAAAPADAGSLVQSGPDAAGPLAEPPIAGPVLVANLGSRRLTIENNAVFGDTALLVELRGSAYTLVRRNYLASQARPSLIALGSEPGFAKNRPTIHENIFVCAGATGSAIRIGSQVQRARVYNNTFYDCGSSSPMPLSGAIHLAAAADAESRGTAVYNNIFYSGIGRARSHVLHAGVEGVPSVLDFNLYYSTAASDRWVLFSGTVSGISTSSLRDWQARSGLDLHSISDDPLFVNATGTIYPVHYKLRSESRARNAGCDPLGKCTSSDGVTDLGAYPRDDATPIGIRNALNPPIDPPLPPVSAD